MTKYTVTIVPDDGSGSSTTLIVNTSGAETVITDVHLHAAGGLSDGQMPVVDFRLLLAAINPSPRTATVVEATADPAPIEAQTLPRRDDAGQSAPAASPDSDPPPRRRRSSKPVKSAATSSADTPGAPRRARRAPRGSKATPPDADVPAAEAKPRVGRTYRRIPDDFASVYATVTSVKDLAKHYNVPRHTAQGWVTRTRRAATT